MMECAQLSRKLHGKLWPEAANEVTDLDNFYPVEDSSQGSAYKFFGKGYKYILDSSKIFGEACTVTDHNKIKSKLAQQGKPCIWLGYTKNHKAGTFFLYNTVTMRIFLSRHATFMHKTFQEYKQDNALRPHVKCDNHDSSLPESKYDKDNDGDENSDAVYAKKPRLVIEHGSDTEEDTLEDAKTV